MGMILVKLKDLTLDPSKWFTAIRPCWMLLTA